MSMRRGDKGPMVLALQKKLIALNYDCGPRGADGDLGKGTIGAVHDFEQDYLGPVMLDDLIPDTTLAAIDRAYQSKKGAPRPPGFLDLTARHNGQHKRGVRPWNQIDAICLHQTAGDLGEKPERWSWWPTRDADGDLVHSTLKAHLGVTRGGQVFLVHDLNALVYHGNSFNNRSVGIELSGTYEGVAGRPTTWWQPTGVRSPQTPTPELLVAAKVAIEWVVAEVAARGGKIKYLFAHRQSSAERESDPGDAIWKGVALPMLQKLGLSDGGPRYKVGSGEAIPMDWDPSKVGIPY